MNKKITAGLSLSCALLMAGCASDAKTSDGDAPTAVSDGGSTSPADGSENAPGADPDDDGDSDDGAAHSGESVVVVIADRWIPEDGQMIGLRSGIRRLEVNGTLLEYDTGAQFMSAASERWTTREIIMERGAELEVSSSSTDAGVGAGMECGFYVDGEVLTYEHSGDGDVPAVTCKGTIP